jgi:hypothetical protein
MRKQDRSFNIAATPPICSISESMEMRSALFTSSRFTSLTPLWAHNVLIVFASSLSAGKTIAFWTLQMFFMIWSSETNTLGYGGGTDPGSLRE